MNAGSQEFNLRLISEIKKRPCLYDKNMVSYNRKDLQDKAWAAIAGILGRKVSFCKFRWRNLRCVYIRHMKRLSLGTLRRPYYLMNAMHFTLPFIKPLNDEIPFPMELIEELNDETPEMVIDQESQYIIDMPVEIKSPQCLSRSASPEAGPSFVTVYRRPSDVSQFNNENITQPSNLRKSKHQNSAILKTHNADEIKIEKSVEIDKSVEINKSVQMNQPGVTPTLELQDDAKKMFLLSLLPDVYAMSDVQMRTFKREVLNIIGKIFDAGS